MKITKRKKTRIRTTFRRYEYKMDHQYLFDCRPVITHTILELIYEKVGDEIQLEFIDYIFDLE